MQICFIGIGSIGKRHILNLKEILGDKVQIDVLRSGNGSLLSDEIRKCVRKECFSSAELENKYDAVFITNPTAMHYVTLEKYLEKSDSFFIEKPVFVTGEEDVSVFLESKKTFYVACPLRYTNVIRYLKENVDFSEIYAMRCISSSYLPDWRVGTDYTKSYSAHKSMGGGVSIDLVHEWDYVRYLVGEPNYVKSIISKKSNLQISSDDIATYIAEYDDKIVEIHLDYFGRNPIRNIELFGKNDTLCVDILNQQVIWRNAGKHLDLSQDRDEYQRRELQHFFDIISGKVGNDNDLCTAMNVLQIARGVK